MSTTNEQTTHTPGPWNVSKAGMDRPIYADSEHAFDLAIVRGGGSDKVTDANARLIAAAPDLLDACKALLYHFAGGNAGLDESRRYVEAKRAAMAAIAKATEDEHDDDSTPWHLDPDQLARAIDNGGRRVTR